MAAVRYDGTDRYFAHRAAAQGLRRPPRHLGRREPAAAGRPARGRHRGPAVLLSTRDHGRVSKEFPLLERFNYVVALVPLADGKDLLVDATEPAAALRRAARALPQPVGRLIDQKPDESRWVDLMPAQRRVHYQQVALDAGCPGRPHGQGARGARRLRRGRGPRASWPARARKNTWPAWPSATKAGPEPSPAVAQADNVDKPLALDYEFAQPAESPAATGTAVPEPAERVRRGPEPFRHETAGLPRRLRHAAGRNPAGDPDPAGRLRAGRSAQARRGGAARRRRPLHVQRSGHRHRGRCSSPAASRCARPCTAAEQYADLRELYRLMLEKQAEKLMIQKKAGS